MIAAGAQNTGPLATIQGVAPKAFLGNYKIFGSPGVNDYAYQSALVAALTDAVNDGMDVVTLSLSEGDPATYGPLDVDPVNCADSSGDTHCDVRVEAVENAVKLGMVVVTSAGNDGNTAPNYPTLNSIHTPGTAPSAITVGASMNSHVFYQAVHVSGPGAPSNLQNIRALFGNGPQVSPPPAPRPRCDPIAERRAGLLGSAGGVARGGHRVGPARHVPVQQQGDQRAECGRRWRRHLPAKRLGYAAQRVRARRRHSGRHDREHGWRGAEELPGCESGRNRYHGPDPFTFERPGQHSVAQLFARAFHREFWQHPDLRDQAGTGGARRRPLHGRPEAGPQRRRVQRHGLYQRDGHQLRGPHGGRGGGAGETESQYLDTGATQIGGGEYRDSGCDGWRRHGWCKLRGRGQAERGRRGQRRRHA